MDWLKAFGSIIITISAAITLTLIASWHSDKVLNEKEEKIKRDHEEIVK